VLYQLSYAHHKKPFLQTLARLAGFEPATPGLEGRCSIRMSYRRFVCPLSWCLRLIAYPFGRGRGI
jgi:hypothetical protein